MSVGVSGEGQLCLAWGLFCPLMAAGSRPNLIETTPHISEASVSPREPGKVLARTRWGMHQLHKGDTKVTPHTERTARSDRHCNSPHMDPKLSNHILQSLMPVLCTAIVGLDLEFPPLLWIPFHWPISDSRSSIRNQCCRNAAIISEYWKIRTLKTNSWLTQALSFTSNTDKAKIWLEVQLLFLMHSCGGWYRLFLPRCWRGVCGMLSVTHYQYCMDQWWREGKLFVGSAERLLVPRIIGSEATYLFVQNSHGIKVADTVQTYFHSLFPAGFFVPYDYTH